MTVNRAQFTALLEPTLRDIKSDADYPRKPYVGLSLYNVASSKKAIEHDFQWAGLGDFQVKSEGMPVTYTDPLVRGTKDYTHVRRASGYQITQEMLDHCGRHGIMSDIEMTTPDRINEAYERLKRPSWAPCALFSKLGGGCPKSHGSLPLPSCGQFAVIETVYQTGLPPLPR